MGHNFQQQHCSSKRRHNRRSASWIRTPKKSRIFNTKKIPKLIQDYNNMALGLTILNTEKDTNLQESAAKKVKGVVHKEKKDNRQKI